ncbi:hypothetical protein [Miniphocaeibacter halophilus]|uniref:SHOCT domain-containing protein n=1 Tax=Miniphocaeibacter halophilus TaxID=2931922 RepID=A0AC61MU50_9FIRM|nr:hypothetical protein [Miniphocaeibacter halophilus]QQK09092.1 SHOCT domain-containing protein [Miniphocaeibacter halophilus]
MDSKNINIAKTLTFIGAVIGIVGGVIMFFTVVGVIFGVVDIIGGVTLLKYKDFSDEEFKEKSNNILVWGIIFIFTAWVVGGICLLVAYFLANYYESARNNSNIDELMELEKAFELMQKGVITEEEYEKIKEKIINEDKNRY